MREHLEHGGNGTSGCFGQVGRRNELEELDIAAALCAGEEEEEGRVRKRKKEEEEDGPKRMDALSVKRRKMVGPR